MTKVTTKEMEEIERICWRTVDNLLMNMEEKDIIHDFTMDIVNYLNVYCTKEKPAI